MDQKEFDRPNKPTEWTLMFYFASDNPLAPGVISQLKALKNAGYHRGVNVLAYFDPEVRETPTHIFDVNAIEKIESEKPQIGFANDPFVRNLMYDKLWGDELSRDGKTPIRQLLIQQLEKRNFKFNPRKPPASNDDGNDDHGRASDDRRTRPQSGPKESLAMFLNFCAEKYPAEHYMLFIIGHGQIVGDDVFLYDEHAAKHAVTLTELGEELKKFKAHENVRKAEFDLVSFHSCSMSSVEITSELKGTAKFMLASQGTAFVGSWPYLSILIRIFNDFGEPSLDIKEMIKKMFFYVRHNSTDFVLAGYSFDLCLCELGEGGVTAVEKAIKDLAAELKRGLAEGTSPIIADAILLAHWRSQSYWQENYTDVYDFCFCLEHYCNELGNNVGNMGSIQTAAGKVMDALIAERPGDDKYGERLVTIAQFVGPGSQYSHGLSVFFPWSEPPQDRPIMSQYPGYAFQEKTDWFGFLKEYFRSTMRKSRREESDPRIPAPHQSPAEALREDMAAIMFGAAGGASVPGALDDDDPPPVKTRPTDPMGKVSPRDPMGGDCACGSIKNFPHDTRPRLLRARNAQLDKDGPTFFSF